MPALMQSCKFWLPNAPALAPGHAGIRYIYPSQSTCCEFSPSPTGPAAFSPCRSHPDQSLFVPQRHANSCQDFQLWITHMELYCWGRHSVLCTSLWISAGPTLCDADLVANLCRLYGLTVHQTFRYTRLYPKDKIWLKIFVRAVCLCMICSHADDSNDNRWPESCEICS